MNAESADQNTPLRMHIALQLLRAWNSGTAGFSADVVMTVNKWIDEGLVGPIPWPDNPFFAEWAAEKGYCNVNGNVGFRFSAKLTERPDTPNVSPEVVSSTNRSCEIVKQPDSPASQDRGGVVNEKGTCKGTDSQPQETK